MTPGEAERLRRRGKLHGAQEIFRKCCDAELLMALRKTQEFAVKKNSVSASIRTR